MKYEWRKQDKSIYLPKQAPEIIDVPTMKYFTISGKGNPNSPAFSELIKTLYAASYAVKMMPKKSSGTRRLLRLHRVPFRRFLDTRTR